MAASSSAMSSLENELTCSICTDILYDPITLLDCLHTHCGACAKSWFTQQQQNSQGHTCPLCRKSVRDARPNSTLTNLLELFLAQHPEKKRSDEDIAEMRRKFTPGDSVLTSTGSTEEPALPRSPGFSTSPGSFSIQHPEHLPDSSNLPEEMAILRSLMQSLAYHPNRATSSPPMPAFQLNGQSQPRNRFSPLPRSGLMFPSPLEFPLHNTIASQSLSPPTSPSSIRSPTSRPQKIADILRRAQGRYPITITCDHCSSPVSEDVHHECTQCEGFHLCQRCMRSGITCPQNHRMQQQRLCAREDTQRYQLERGVFCNICEAWTDPDCGMDMTDDNSFWCCTVCNDRKGWTYCLPCVRKGSHCTHDLTLWTNRRSLVNAPNAFAERSARFALVVGGPGVIGDPRSTAYVRRTWYRHNCDLCTVDIPSSHSWFHCTTCSNGDWDECMNCFYSSAESDAEDAFRCPQGHEMTLLTTINDEAGSRKVLTSPARTLPEAFEDAELDTVQSDEEKTAIAVQSHWPEDCINREGERKWGGNGVLGFPKGAQITDIAQSSYIEGEEVKTICWGWYCGVGGLFDISAVRFVNV